MTDFIVDLHGPTGTETEKGARDKATHLLFKAGYIVEISAVVLNPGTRSATVTYEYRVDPNYSPSCGPR